MTVYTPTVFLQITPILNSLWSINMGHLNELLDKTKNQNNYDTKDKKSYAESTIFPIKQKVIKKMKR